jgi:hypothetical protein
MLARILSTPGMADRVCSETAPFLSLGGLKKSREPQTSPNQQDQIYADGLTRSCPLLRACFLETLR